MDSTVLFSAPFCMDSVLQLGHPPTKCHTSMQRQHLFDAYSVNEFAMRSGSDVAVEEAVDVRAITTTPTATTTVRRSLGIPVKPSRWKRDKSKMGGLEQQLAQQQLKAKALEQEQRKLRLRNVALEHAIASRDWQLGVLNRLSSSERAHLTTAALTSASREFVSSASLLLLKLSDTCSAVTDQPILSRISDLVSELLHVVGSAYVLNPGVHFTLIASHLEGAANAPETKASARADERHWEQVARKISVSPQQVEEMTACWNLTNEAMTWLQQQASELHKELSAAVELHQSCKLIDIVDRLSTLDFKQGVLYRSFCFAIFFRIFSPFHVARAMVHSFPYFVDTRELVRKLLHMHGVV